MVLWHRGWDIYYVEKLSLEWAGLDEATADAYFTNMILGMAALSVVDIGINYEGWGIEETSNFLTTYYGELDKNTCQNFIDTCANDPGVISQQRATIKLKIFLNRWLTDIHLTKICMLLILKWAVCHLHC